MVYQQIVGIPMGTNCAPLIADLFLFCYKSDFMSLLHKSKQCDLIDTFLPSFLPVGHLAGLDGFVGCIDLTYLRDSLTNYYRQAVPL